MERTRLNPSAVALGLAIVSAALFVRSTVYDPTFSDPRLWWIYRVATLLTITAFVLSSLRRATSDPQLRWIALFLSSATLLFWLSVSFEHVTYVTEVFRSRP
jgi:hypothetical protein